MTVSSTVTFLFTDIEDSTRLWDAQPARMAAVLARHDALCRGVVAEARGRVVKTTGDGLYAAFEDPFEALSAAIELQRGVQALARESDLALKMRCGLHCGAAEARDGDYFGPAVNCAARVMDAAHGGQVLVTQAVVDRAGGRHPEGADLLHLGRMRLRGVASPVDVWQVRHGDLRGTFPPLRTLDSIPHNLPRHATSFVGREIQIAEVIAHFDATNLLAICRQLGDRAGIAASLCGLGYVATEEGALLSARTMHAESATIRLELGDRRGMAESLEGLANVSLALTRPLGAACIWGAADACGRDIGLPMPPGLSATL